jgi:hypothetical protein
MTFVEVRFSLSKLPHFLSIKGVLYRKITAHALESLNDIVGEWLALPCRIVEFPVSKIKK